MLELKDLGIKQYTTTGGKIRKDRYGEFKCQYCDNTVELKTNKGKHQKSCGGKECKKKAKQDGYNYKLSANNAGNFKHGFSNSPHYGSFKEMHANIKEMLCDEWKESLNNFINDMFISYSELRLKHPRNKVTLFSGEEKIKDKNNSSFQLVRNIVKPNYKINSRNEMDNHIYIIRSSMNDIKIGVTSSLDSRIKKIKNQSSQKIDYEYIYHKRIDGAYYVERYLHKIFEEFRTGGEWFELNELQINDVIKHIENSDDLYIDYLNKIENEKKEKVIKIENTKNIHEKKLKEYDSEPERFNLKEEKKEEYRINQQEKNIRIKREQKENYINPLSIPADKKLYHKYYTNIYSSSFYNKMELRDTLENFELFYLNHKIEIDNAIKIFKTEKISFKRKINKNGFTWSNIEILTTSSSNGQNTAKQVAKIDKDGLQLEIFSSAADASRETTKATPGHITACCQGKRKTHAGYIWEYVA